MFRVWGLGLRLWVTVIIVQMLGKYVSIGSLDPKHQVLGE